MYKVNKLNIFILKIIIFSQYLSLEGLRQKVGLIIQSQNEEKLPLINTINLSLHSKPYHNML